MFSSPRISRPSMDTLTSQRLLDEKCQTIEQLKKLVEDLEIRHQKKEQELIQHIGMLYHDLQQSKRKMAHLVLKYQQQKKSKESIQTISTQTNDSSTQTKSPKSASEDQTYYTLHSNDHLQYISATPQPPSSDHSLSSLSTTDQSSTKHNESSSSAYNTAESLPSSTYSDETQSLARVLNAACTMYTTHDNLEHTIKLQEELFRQRLRLRGIDLNKTEEETASEHFYDNIDGETSDMEKQPIVYRNQTSLPWCPKKTSRTVTFNLNPDEHEKKIKDVPSKVRLNEPCYPIGKRKHFKSLSKINLSKLTNHKKHNFLHPNKHLLSSNMLTVTIT